MATTASNLSPSVDEPAPQDVDMVAARGAKRVGFIWILTISTVLAILALSAVWVVMSHGRPSGAAPAASRPLQHAPANPNAPAAP